VDSKSFEPAVNAIWKSPLRDSIAGFASINYRLSSYPSHSKFPSLPDDPSRNVHYPAHIEDVAQALLYLDENYQIGNRYLLVGHSAGATMAFELHNSYLQSGSLPQPVCVLGISGIFDFEAFVENHSEIPVYKKIMDNAFPDKSLWEEASPYINRSLGHIWEQAKAVVISHSKHDGLVEYSQATSMLERVRAIAHCSERVHFLEASGAHDEIWENGNILAGLIMECLKMLQSYRRD
jgi:kynurenine formamidase